MVDLVVTVVAARELGDAATSGISRGGGSRLSSAGIRGGSRVGAGGRARSSSSGTRARGSTRATKDSGSRHGVRSGTAVDAVVGGETLSVAVVDTRDLHGIRGLLTAARVGDLDVGAVEVELGSTGSVKSKMLNADKVLATGDLSGDGEVNTVLVPDKPVLTRRLHGEVGTKLIDLEPVSRAIVGLDIVVSGSGHVNLNGTRVLDLAVQVGAKANGVTGADLGSLSRAGVGLGSSVAPHLVARQDIEAKVRLETLSRAADVLVLGRLDIVDVEMGEEVVSGDEVGKSQDGSRKGDGGLHDD